MTRRINHIALFMAAIAFFGAGNAYLTATNATAATTAQSTPQRYVRQVCAALSTWYDKTDDNATDLIQQLQNNKRSAASTRQRVVGIYTGLTKATDQLIAATKATGTPRMPNGQQAAGDYLQTLGDARTAMLTAEHAAARAKINNKATLATSLTSIESNFDDAITAIGDPLTVLSTHPILSAAVQSDTGCGDVLDDYRPNITSGLLVGECTTDSEQSIACTKPHYGEVSLVTTYPAAADAPWPGNDAMNSYTDQTCGAAFSAYVGLSVEQSQYDYAWFSPNPGSDWDGGDHEIVCTVTSTDNTPLTSSVKGTAR